VPVEIGTQIENYRIVEKIGEGGMGAVFRAVDVMLERDVALKFLRPELAKEPELVDRFRAEAVVLARLSHQFIASVYGLHRHGSDWFMAMEYVKGESLEARLRRVARFPPEVAMDITSMVLQALEYAHQHGVVHRDIKPANIILTPTGLVKVMDFGIAKVLGGQRLTRVGSIVGTIGYMSPEQIRGEDVDRRADLYSVGIVLYEMLSGRVPFHADTDWALMQAQIQSPPPPLRQMVDVPDVLEGAVLRALEKTPDRRYQSATEFQRSLHDAARLSGLRPPSLRTPVPGALDETTTFPGMAPAPGSFTPRPGTPPPPPRTPAPQPGTPPPGPSAPAAWPGSPPASGASPQWPGTPPPASGTPIPRPGTPAPWPGTPPPPSGAPWPGTPPPAARHTPAPADYDAASQPTVLAPASAPGVPLPPPAGPPVPGQPTPVPHGRRTPAPGDLEALSQPTVLAPGSSPGRAAYVDDTAPVPIPPLPGAPPVPPAAQAPPPPAKAAAKAKPAAAPRPGAGARPALPVPAWVLGAVAGVLVLAVTGLVLWQTGVIFRPAPEPVVEVPPEPAAEPPLESREVAGLYELAPAIVGIDGSLLRPRAVTPAVDPAIEAARRAAREGLAAAEHTPPSQATAPAHVQPEPPREAAPPALPATPPAGLPTVTFDKVKLVRGDRNVEFDALLELNTASLAVKNLNGRVTWHSVHYGSIAAASFGQQQQTRVFVRTTRYVLSIRTQAGETIELRLDRDNYAAVLKALQQRGVAVATVP
jgi:serine/threonine protein kinase